MIPTLGQIREMGLKKKSDSRTEDEKMREINAILKYHADKMGCKVSDLQWRRDRGGAIHIRKKSGILLR